MSSMEPFDRAVAYLALRPRTTQEIRAYLKKKEYGEEEITGAIGKLMEYGYLDDKEYAKIYIRVAIEKGYGKMKITRTLMEKGIDGETADAAWMAHEEETGKTVDEKKRALELGVKMTKQHLQEGKELDEKFFARVGRRLASQGYGADSVYFVIGKLRGLKK